MAYIVKAVFGSESIVKTDTIYQYNSGQVLQVEGLAFTNSTEFHLAIHGKDTASIITGTIANNIAKITIPEVLMINDFCTCNYRIDVFVYVIDNDSGYTKYKIIIPVKSRPRPKDYYVDLPTVPELKSLKQELNTAVNNFNDAYTEIDQLKSATASLNEDIRKTDDTTRILFNGGAWKGTTVGDKISTEIFPGLKSVSLVTALKGDVFSLATTTVGGWSHSYFILDANFTILAIGESNFNGILTIENDAARYIAVSVAEDYIDKFKFFLHTRDYTKLVELEENIITAINNTNSNTKELTTKANIVYEKGDNITDTRDGIYNVGTKSIDFETNPFYVHAVIENLKVGDCFYCSGVSHNNGSNYPFIVFTDADNTALNVIKSDILDEKFNDYQIIVDNSKYSKIYVNGNSQLLKVIRGNEIDLPEVLTKINDLSPSIENNTWFDVSVQNAVIDEQKKNPFAWGTLDKGAIVFTFDDTLNDIDLVESISEEYNVPVCFSAIPENMNNITTATGGNKKVKEVLTEAVKHGNEVLCHSQVALSSESTDTEIYAQFVTNKKELEAYGFVIRGIIEAGSGGGEDTFDTKKAEMYLRLLYNYSDKYGEGLNLPNFYNPRTYINRNKETNHTYVDNCVKNKTILIFVTHSITDTGTSTLSTSEDVLRDLMEYVKTKDVHLLTFGGVYDKFRSSNLENIIKTLTLQ